MPLQPKVPNLFIVGVPKAGTTSLFHWLGAHPQIGKSSENELRYLMDADDPLCRPDGFNAEGLDGYARFYSDSLLDEQTKYLIDASPQYYYQKTAQSVIGRLQDSQVVMILRKPSARIYSLYNYSKSNKVALPASMSFSDFIHEVRRGNKSEILRGRPMLYSAIEHSRYSSYISRWQSIVGPDRLKVYFFEELVRNPRDVLRRLAKDLRVEPGFYDSYGFPARNESFDLRHRGIHKIVHRSRKKMPSWMRRYLKPAYMYLNTQKPKRSLPEHDRKILKQLDLEFRDTERELAELLERDGAIWSKPKDQHANT